MKCHNQSIELWTVIEVEERDITDDLVSNVGSAGSELQSVRRRGKRVTLRLIFFFNVYLFLNTLSGMIYVDTLIDVLLRFSSRKSGGIIHDKIEISSFSVIILDVQSQ